MNAVPVSGTMSEPATSLPGHDFDSTASQAAGADQKKAWGGAKPAAGLELRYLMLRACFDNHVQNWNLPVNFTTFTRASSSLSKECII